MKDFISAIEIMRRTCKKQFVITLSDADFSKLELELSSMQRFPETVKGFRFPHLIIHGVLIKNEKYSQSVVNEIKSMLEYLSDGK